MDVESLAVMSLSLMTCVMAVAGDEVSPNHIFGTGWLISSASGGDQHGHLDMVPSSLGAGEVSKPQNKFFPSVSMKSMKRKRGKRTFPLFIYLHSRLCFVNM